MKNIFLALDVERYDERLVVFTLDLCKRYSAKLWIVHVSPYSSEFLNQAEEPDYIRFGLEEDLREEHRFLQNLALRMQGENLQAVALVVGGEIVNALLTEASKIGADLIITGVHQHGPIANVLGGNTAVALLKKTKIPLLCYPL